MRRYAEQLGLSERQIDEQGELMRDWSMSAPAGAKVDWEAAWRNWVKRAHERGPPRPQTNRRSQTDGDHLARKANEYDQEIENGYASNSDHFEHRQGKIIDGPCQALPGLDR